MCPSVYVGALNVESRAHFLSVQSWAKQNGKRMKKNGAKCLNSVQLGNRFLLKSDLWAQNFRADLMDNSSYCLYDRKNSIPPSKCRWLKYL